MKKVALVLLTCLTLTSCYSVKFFNPEEEETQKKAAKGAEDFGNKFVQQGTLPQSRDSKANQSLTSGLSRSLGNPKSPIDIESDAQVGSVTADLDRYKKEAENTKSLLWGLGSVALTLLLGGSGYALKLRNAIGQAKDVYEEVKQKADDTYTQFKGQIVGTSQLKATIEHGRLEIMDVAKTDVNKALQMALKLTERDTINFLLKNGAEAVGGSKNLDTHLMNAKDDIEQNLLNRPLIDPRILMNS